MGVSEMETDMMDAIMRRFMQGDDKLYSSEGRLRWRHFFESDILTAVVAGCFDIENPCIRNPFVGSHLKYDVCNCRMLFFPVILHQRWVCFSWDLKHEQYPSVRSSMVLFTGWNHDWAAASVDTFKWRFDGMKCLNRSGVLCAYFCRCFDGDILVPDIEQEDVGRISSIVFGEMCGLTGTV